MESIKEFIKQARKSIRKESTTINNLQRKIYEYQTLVYVIERTGTLEQVNYYKEKINQCHEKIDIALDNVKSCRDRIAVMRTVEKIIKRGEKCA